jgi:hypothetical protein
MHCDALAVCGLRMCESDYSTVELKMVVFSKEIVDEFETHATKMRDASRARREAVQLRAAVDDKTDGSVVNIRDTFGVRMPEDKWEGCMNLRTLRSLLSLVDDRGFERSPHQASAGPPSMFPELGLTHCLALCQTIDGIPLLFRALCFKGKP